MMTAARIPPEDWARIARFIPGPEPRMRPLPAAQASLASSPLAATTGWIPVSHPNVAGNEARYLAECISSNWLSSAGPFVKRFEQEFAAAVGCAHGVACANGTVALHLALATLGIGPGDEVILPTFTMVATANAVSYLGARPVFVDAEPDTWNIDVAQVAARITPKTKAIVVVHTYGHPAEMAPLQALASQHGLHLVEDAAEAHGASYHGRPAGSLGDVATFSFYANKIITTGEGGMLTTNDAKIADLARKLRDHAFSTERHFWHEYRGFNYRMTNLQAAVGVAQTERLAELVRLRRLHAERYRARLSDVPGLTMPVERPSVENVYWMFGLLVEDAFGCTRDELREWLASQGVETRTFFIPMHLQPIYYADHQGERFPIAEQLGRKGLYLPSGPHLTAEAIDYIAARVAAAPRSLLQNAA